MDFKVVKYLILIKRIRVFIQVRSNTNNEAICNITQHTQVFTFFELFIIDHDLYYNVFFFGNLTRKSSSKYLPLI